MIRSCALAVSPLWRSQLSGFKLCCCLLAFIASVLCSCHLVSSEAPKWSMLCMSVNKKRNNSQTFGLSSSLTHGLYPSTLGILNPNVLDMLATYSYIPMPLIRWQPTTPTSAIWQAATRPLRRAAILRFCEHGKATTALVQLLRVSP